MHLCSYLSETRPPKPDLYSDRFSISVPNFSQTAFRRFISILYRFFFLTVAILDDMLCHMFSIYSDFKQDFDMSYVDLRHMLLSSRSIEGIVCTFTFWLTAEI